MSARRTLSPRPRLQSDDLADAATPPAQIESGSAAAPRALLRRGFQQWLLWARRKQCCPKQGAAVQDVAVDGTGQNELPKAAATDLLAVLSNEDMLEAIGKLAWEPLLPHTACALAACSCALLDVMMHAPLPALRVSHEEAKALAVSGRCSCADMRDESLLAFGWPSPLLTSARLRTLGMLLDSGALQVQNLLLEGNQMGDEGIIALCEGLGLGTAPCLIALSLCRNGIGPVGASALAATLNRGAMPNLQCLRLDRNVLRDEGLTALAAPLRRLPALRKLSLTDTCIHNGGVTALFGGLGKGELKALQRIDLSDNLFSDLSCEAIIDSRALGALPALFEICCQSSVSARNPAWEFVAHAVQLRHMLANRPRGF